MTTATTQRFKVLGGIHYERNPDPEKSKNRHDPDRDIKYVKDDIVESTRPLDEIFPNKFEKAIPGVNAPIVVTDARRQAVAELIDSGRCPEDDRKFLEELSEDGFARLQRYAQTKPGASGKKTASPLGEDVTSLFQRAYDEGFKVFRNPAGKHQVTKGASAKPLNKEPLEENQVEQFVGDYLKEK